MRLDRLTTLALAFLVLVVGTGLAEDKAPRTAPAEPKAAATVGSKKILAEEVYGLIDRELARMSPARRKEIRDEQIAQAKKERLNKRIERELISLYLAPLPCTDMEVVREKAEIAIMLKQNKNPLSVERFLKINRITDEAIRNQVRLKRLQEAATSKEKVAAYVKASPVSYFDGTKVGASHILIACPVYASPAEAGKARRKLEAIAAQIAAGKISFADAAMANSTCPSKARGGDLGTFGFTNMVPPFAQAAFGMKVGQVSGVVRTRFGFHLIKVTSREDGDKKPSPAAEKIAANVLMAQLFAKIMSESAARNPVVIIK